MPAASSSDARPEEADPEPELPEDRHLEVETDEEFVGREEQLLRESMSLQHRLCHMLKNLYCETCRRSRMYKRRTVRTRLDPLSDRGALPEVKGYQIALAVPLEEVYVPDGPPVIPLKAAADRALSLFTEPSPEDIQPIEVPFSELPRDARAGERHEYITLDRIIKYGPSPACRACENVKGKHTPACRARFDGLIKADKIDASKSTAKARSIAPSTPAPELPASETPGPEFEFDAPEAPVHPDELPFSAGIPPEETATEQADALPGDHTHEDTMGKNAKLSAFYAKELAQVLMECWYPQLWYKSIPALDVKLEMKQVSMVRLELLSLAAPRLVAATCTPRATTAAPDATDSGEGADVEMARMARRAAGLCQLGVDLSTALFDDGQTLLMLAAEQGWTELCRYLCVTSCRSSYLDAREDRGKE
ncbi:unnamed protein product [Cladocopium goreaui]|uniref:Uncharacterized protein n=1 Tax=Cladocopium goreaui TaxID=2562237 RepID=A0A9P1M3H5_9DINO|nr:unnamed protein product [Cladocopium goreaui]